MVSKRPLVVAALAVVAGAFGAPPASAQAPVKVLVFHETSGTPDPSIAAGVTAIEEIGAAHGFDVDDTADSADFTAQNLGNYRAVVFLTDGGDLLAPAEETAFRNYVEGGGGFVGVNDAARVETGSDWFTGLIGARPGTSPAGTQEAVVEVPDHVHPATRDLPTEWTRTDEWLNWAQNPAGKVHTVAIARERSYDPGAGANGWNHPISWCRDYEGGRSFYTGMGGTAASFGEADFRTHLLGAIQWAAGLVRGNCKATIDSNYKSERLTAPDKFQGGSAANELDQIGEPHGLSIAPDGRVFYIGRADKGPSTEPVDSWTDPNGFRGWGTIHVWDPSKPAGERVKLVGVLDVFGDSVGGNELQKKEEGLIGIALDPDFEHNHYVWLHYTPYGLVNKTTHIATRRVSRFTYDEQNAELDLSSEKVIIQWTYQAHSCCHMGGDMDFDKDGNLYILTGDTNSSGNAGAGYSGNIVGNEFPAGGGGISFNDARRTAGNTNDLNGKILRIRPRANPGPTPGVGSTYDIPPNNLFTGAETEPGKTGPLTRPEIYVMGVRNPTRLWIDRRTGWLMTGWVGPDAPNPSAELGPSRYENLAAIPKAGNYGWPYCTGNNQPYRDRNNDRSLAGWYDCAAPKNNSPYNTGLTNLPPIEPANMWYSGQGGGPQHPIDQSTGRPDYGQPPVLAEPYLTGGGGQAVMPGPLYRYDPDSDSADKWPEYWDGKWFFGDHEGRARRAVGLDADTVDNHKEPKTAVDIEGIVRGDGAGAQVMGMEFGPDGALYTLDYGGGFFTVTSRSSLWKVSYTGGPSTPMADPDARPGPGAREVRFSSRRSGGVSYAWDFGDGGSSTEANPTHTYATAGDYTAKLTVTYADGGTDSHTVTAHALAQADTQAPVTTASLNPTQPGPGGTYTVPVTVTLNASDEGQSGVEKTEYRVDGGEFKRYTAPFRVSEEGGHSVEFRSSDFADNVEAVQEVTFTIAVVETCTPSRSDEFSGTQLDRNAWTVERENAAALSVSGGRLNLLVRAGDMIGGTNSAQNVLLRDAPDTGSWTVQTKLDISELTTGGEQAGLVLWKGEDPNNFAKVVFINKGNGQRWFEYVLTTDDVNRRLPNTGAIANIPNDVYIRALSNGAGTINAEYSLDGSEWNPIGPPITELGNDLKVGLKVSNNADSGHAARFDYFRIDCSDRVPPITTASVDPAQPNGGLGWYRTAPTVTLTADDGAGDGVRSTEYSIDGAAFKPYTAPFEVDGAGDHTVRYRSTDDSPHENQEAIKSLALRVDATPPATTAAVAATGRSARITLDAKDGTGSGVARTEYRVDGGTWRTYSRTDEPIFDGTAASLAQWMQAGSGHFDLLPGGAITPVGGLGMLWYPVSSYGDFAFKFQFRDGRTDGGYSNGGAFVRFPDPRVPLAQRTDKCSKTGSAASDPAWVAIYCGHEIQLFDGPDGQGVEPQKTGSIYNFSPNDLAHAHVTPRGQWNDYEVRVVGQHYTVTRNGTVIKEFDNVPGLSSSRPGDPPTTDRQFTVGYVGLQNHSTADLMQYRNMRVENLSGDTSATGPFTVSGSGMHTVEFRSVDWAGTTEAKKARTFRLGQRPQPSPPPTGTEPPSATPKFSLAKPARTTLGRFARRGLAVEVKCGGAMQGSAALTVAGRTKRRLHLRSATLARKSLRCVQAGTKTVTLKPSRRVARALRRSHGSVKATVKVRLKPIGGRASTHTRRLTLRR